MNLGALAYFINTTFRFVQQQEREELRERYTAQFAQPRELTLRLRQQLYTLGAEDLMASDSADRQPLIIFGSSTVGQSEIEIHSTFKRPMILQDVRMTWVRWVIRRWATRSMNNDNTPHQIDGSASHSPRSILCFTVPLDIPQIGTVSWCQRQGGLPLTAIERFVLRRAFRFRRTTNEA